MKVGTNVHITHEALAYRDTSYNESIIKDELTRGLAEFLVKECKDEVEKREVNYGTAISFSLKLHVYTKKQHRKIVKALDEAYGRGFTNELLKGEQYEKEI